MVGMSLVFMAGNSTSGANSVSAWLSPTGIGTIVLAIGVFFAGYEILLDRRDRRMNRERELKERPHFKFEEIKLDEESLRIIKNGKETVITLGVVKFLLRNEGERVAENAQPFVHLFQRGGKVSERTVPTVWTAARGEPIPVPVKVPPYTGDSLEDLAEAVKHLYMGDKEMAYEDRRDIAPGIIAASVCFFTIKGCDLLFHSNPNVKAQAYPASGVKVAINVIMDNAPSSIVWAPKPVRLKSWNELESL